MMRLFTWMKRKLFHHLTSIDSDFNCLYAVLCRLFAVTGRLFAEFYRLCSVTGRLFADSCRLYALPQILGIRLLKNLLIFLHWREKSCFFHFGIVSDWTFFMKTLLQRRQLRMLMYHSSYLLQHPRRMIGIYSK